MDNVEQAAALYRAAGWVRVQAARREHTEHAVPCTDAAGAAVAAPGGVRAELSMTAVLAPLCRTRT